MGLQEHLQSRATGGQPGSPERQAILVLGMHRSGTSALGGVLSALGAVAPKTLMAPQPDNPLGFFESAAFADAHDALLASAGSNWHDWRPFDLSGIGAEIAAQHREKWKALLISEFGDAPLIFIKDPRICRFLPFILSVLAEMNISPVAFLPIRNPLEVAFSLKRRNAFPLPKSLLLWLRHVLEAEYHSRHLPRYFLAYEEFLTGWREDMNSAAEKTGIVWPANSDISDLKIRHFLTLDLRHEKATADEIKGRQEVMPLVRETYDILTEIVASGENAELLDRLDQLRARFDEVCQVFKAASEELATEQVRDELRARIDELEQCKREKLNLSALLEQRSLEVHQLTAKHTSTVAAHDGLIAERDSLAAANDDLIAAQDAIFASRSWRITAPLRSLRKLLFHRRI